MKLLPYRYLRLKLAARGLLPRSMLARVTAYIVGIDLLLLLFRGLLSLFGLGSSLDGWIRGLATVAGFCAFFLLVRFVRRRLIWRLRNRLIVTYVFIGVIPVVLLITMAGLAGYFLAGQFATFLATSDLQAEITALGTANSELAAHLAAELKDGIPTERAAAMLRTTEQLAPDSPRSVMFWYRGSGVLVQRGAEAPAAPGSLPGWLEKELQNGDFKDFVMNDGRLRLRAGRSIAVGRDRVIAVSSVPVTDRFVTRIAAGLGVIAVYGSNRVANRRREVTTGTRPPSIEINGETIANGALATGGTLPENPGAFDRDVSFLTFLPARDWGSGAQTQIWVTVRTRPSLLYRRLQATLGEFPTIVGAALLVVAAIFAIIELLALLVGVRLTRTMTLAVAELYKATQRVNRGDFSHRIPVTANDQLAALESSFNSMTESLQKLLAEQKEKQRIENELVIAHEVQEQLFPKRVEQLETLEVYGLCRPARTVSGDYFDFLPLGQERMALAVGDISGKGISAALLMATLHSAVRSFLVLYSPEAQAVVPEYAALGAGRGSSGHVTIAGDGAEISPAQWLAMLNRHLYHATPPEKYATLFLGSYDGLSRTLTYSNGGHLPPIILRQDGSILRLEEGGTVVGLFNSVHYDEALIQLRHGDLFVAYSDGITEPENEFGEFGEARLIELVRENSDLPLARIGDEVVRAVQEWIGGGEQPDDITLVLARVP